MSTPEQTDWSMIPGPRLPPLIQLAAIWPRPAAAMLRLRRFGTRATAGAAVPAADRRAVGPGGDPRAADGGPGRSSTPARAPDPRADARAQLGDPARRGAHLEQRRLLLPAFHGERMQRLTALMAELTERRARDLAGGSRSRCTVASSGLTLEIILRAVFGLERGPRLDELRDRRHRRARVLREPAVDRAGGAAVRAVASDAPRLQAVQGAQPTS